MIAVILIVIAVIVVIAAVESGEFHRQKEIRRRYMEWHQKANSPSDVEFYDDKQ